MTYEPHQTRTHCHEKARPEGGREEGDQAPEGKQVMTALAWLAVILVFAGIEWWLDR